MNGVQRLGESAGRTKLKVKYIKKWRWRKRYEELHETKEARLYDQLVVSKRLRRYFLAWCETTRKSRRLLRLGIKLLKRVNEQRLYTCFSAWMDNTRLELKYRDKSSKAEQSMSFVDYLKCTNEIHWARRVLLGWNSAVGRWESIVRGMELQRWMFVSDNSESSCTSYGSTIRSASCNMLVTDTYQYTDSGEEELSRWATDTSRLEMVPTFHGLTEVPPMPFEESSEQFYSLTTQADSGVPYEMFGGESSAIISVAYLRTVVELCSPPMCLERRKEILSHLKKFKNKDEVLDIIPLAHYLAHDKLHWITLFYLRYRLLSRRLRRIILNLISDCNERIHRNLRLTRLKIAFEMKLVLPWLSIWVYMTRVRQDMSYRLSVKLIGSPVMLKWRCAVRRSQKQLLTIRSIFYRSFAFAKFRQSVNYIHGLRSHNAHLQRLKCERVYLLWRQKFLLLRSLRKVTRIIWDNSFGRQSAPLHTLLRTLRTMADHSRLRYRRLDFGCRLLAQTLLKPSWQRLRLNVHFHKWLSITSDSKLASAMRADMIQLKYARGVVTKWKQMAKVMLVKHIQQRRLLRVIKQTWCSLMWTQYLRDKLIDNRLVKLIVCWEKRIGNESEGAVGLCRVVLKAFVKPNFIKLRQFALYHKHTICEVYAKRKLSVTAMIMGNWLKTARKLKALRNLDLSILRIQDRRLKQFAWQQIHQRIVRSRLAVLISRVNKIRLDPVCFTLATCFRHWQDVYLKRYLDIPGDIRNTFQRYWSFKQSLEAAPDAVNMRRWLVWSAHEHKRKLMLCTRRQQMLLKWKNCIMRNRCLYERVRVSYQLKVAKLMFLKWALAEQFAVYENRAAQLAKQNLRKFEIQECLLAFQTFTVVSLWFREVSVLLEQWRITLMETQIDQTIQAWSKYARNKRLGEMVKRKFSILVATRALKKLTSLSSQRRRFGFVSKVLPYFGKQYDPISDNSTPEESPTLMDLRMPEIPPLHSATAKALLQRSQDPFYDNDEWKEQQLHKLGFVRDAGVPDDPRSHTGTAEFGNVCDTTISLSNTRNYMIISLNRIRKFWLRWKLVQRQRKKRLNASYSSIGEASLVVADEWDSALMPPLKSFLDNELRDLEYERCRLEQRRSPPSFS